MNIPITKPVLDKAEAEAITKPLDTGWLVQGPYVARFEELFAEYTGARFARATTSCTTALHLALEALRIGNGDKVVVPAFTYIASANAVLYTGAEVLFCDIELETFNIDPHKLETILERDRECSIKAVMPVDLFGLCADMPKINELAEKYRLKVVEDAACGFAAHIGDKHAGTFATVGCFSFHPRKVITTGEGGMLITDNEGIADKVSSLRDHGAGKSDLQRHREQGGSLLPEFNIKGYNYRMTDFQGALGVSQLGKADYIMSKRREIARRYDDTLKDIEALITPGVPEGYTHAYQSYVCLFTGGEDLSHLSRELIDKLNISRNRFMDKLEAKGISTRQGTHAVHSLGYYRRKYNLTDEAYLAAYAADRLSVTLPLYAQMTDEEFEYVLDNIKIALKPVTGIKN